MNDIPATFWAAGGVSVGLIAAAFLLAGGHHEMVYRWRRRRRARSIFVEGVST